MKNGSNFYTFWCPQCLYDIHDTSIVHHILKLTSFLSTSLDRDGMTSSRASSHASPMSLSLLSSAVSIIGSRCRLNTELDTMSDWKICRKIELAANCMSGWAIGRNSYKTKRACSYNIEICVKTMTYVEGRAVWVLGQLTFLLISEWEGTINVEREFKPCSSFRPNSPVCWHFTWVP